MATEAVCKYMQLTNRPYSANDIVQNMHKEFGKTAVQKALDDLVVQGKIFEKTYGKQKVYCIKQPDSTDTEDDDLKEVEAETERVTQNYKNIEHQVKESENQLRDLLSALTTQEAKAKVAELEENVDTLQVRLSKLSENTQVIPPEERARITKEHEKLLKEYRKRKRICMDIINAIMDGYPKTKKALMEEVGIETDEDVKMKLVQ